MSHHPLRRNFLEVSVVLAISIFLTSTALGQTTAARPDRGTMPTVLMQSLIWRT